MSAAPTNHGRGCVPRATVRVQFHAGYTLDDAVAQVPYFAALGISHLYASPLLSARAGSMHGYDGVDPTQVNPELGGEAALRRLVTALRSHGLGLIVDIVPNHMAASGENPWWVDVLTWGPCSRHAQWFDIDWQPLDPALHGKVLLPVLGQPYGEVLAQGELSLAIDDVSGRLSVAYFEHRFPLSPATCAPLLRDLVNHDEALRPGLAPVVRLFEDAVAQNAAAPVAFERACAALAEVLGNTRRGVAFRAGLARVADDREGLHRLLEQQAHRLAWWRTASDEINWRRFFDVHELVGMQVERPEVFDALHGTLLRLIEEGLIDGLRVDHVDGLTDPGAYCRQLREQVMRRWPHDPAQRPFYLVIEKILTGDETLRTDWAVDGSTGYDFMNQVNAWLHQPAGEAPLGTLWAELSGRPAAFEPEALAARRELLARSFSAQTDATVAALHSVARHTLTTRDVSAAAIRRALVELLIHFPAYRTYALGASSDPADTAHMAQALAGARTTCRREDVPVLDLLAGWLGGLPLDQASGGADARRIAIRRFQQLSAPLAAKAIEDTAFYRYGRLLSRNDVGFDPAVFASDTAHFHRLCADRQRHFPAALLATATHDHKRGEDLRARLAVLSERPAEWRRSVLHWRELNAPLRGGSAPSAGDEAMLYQMLVGAWPIDLAPDDAAGLAALAERLWRWQEKAVREAKLATDWIAPDSGYESGCKDFLHALLDPQRAPAFLVDLHAVAMSLAEPGAINGLVQTLLKYTVPGVPDLYQGTEFWDLSLVDPDNRRPVDFVARAASLRTALATPLADLRDGWRSGAIKQALIARLLACRAAAPALFSQGDYRPLQVDGPQSERLLAFERRAGSQRLVVLAARWPGDLGSERRLPVSTWCGTRLQLDDAQGAWRDVLAEPWHTAPGQVPQFVAGPLSADGLPPLEELLSPLPFAVRVVL
jgi:(1->4)-alpha-D-glucan 1-alpha-D-glucosylmutase